MPADMPDVLARRLKVSRERISPVCELLEAGLSPVFIAHFRKGATGGMDEATLHQIADERREVAVLESLRRQARAIAQQAGALTEALDKAIGEADTPGTIEDLVQAFRPKRRTAGSVARERGLQGLADYAAAGTPDGPDLATMAAEYVQPDREVRSAEDALAGAGHILAERIADAPRIRRAARQLIWDKGLLKSQQTKQHSKAAAEFKGYFNFQEALSHVPPHRVLALNRGERSKALKITIEVPPEDVRQCIIPLVLPKEHRFAAWLEAVVTDAMGRLVLPAIDREIRRELTLRAETHAIDVFTANLRSLLMARPVRGRPLLAVQPGYRTGCKVASLDERGALLGETIIYPLEPQKKWAEGKAALMAELQRHGARMVAIGNGTGCREVEALVSELIDEMALDLDYTIVCEAGAAAYADSDLAKQEFPNLDAAIRATISIGRRLQDPLAELVKIDPRAIGVGLYQHDVDQKRLQRALDETMESCVAAVGADANVASPSMLCRIPGLGDAQVQSLAARRAAAPLRSREELKTLPGWDEKTFLQAAGFLRLHGDHPLDATRVHPEHYADAERLLVQLGHRVDDLAAPDGAQGVRQSLMGLSLEPLAEQLAMPLQILLDLAGALQQPDYDPRDQHHGPIFRQKIRRIEDLQPGMWVKGTVRNVVDFGAFVDIGLKEEGLVHISQFSRRYVRNPLKFLHVGDIVDVRIVSIEADKHRIALTLIPERAPKRRERKPPAEGAAAAPRAPRPAEGGRPAASAPGPRAPARTGRPPPRRAPAGAGDRPRGPRSDRPSRGRSDRRPRTGPPRVIVSKSDRPVDERGDDIMGRPKIRWAYYESDPNQDEWEEEDYEEPQDEDVQDQDLQDEEVQDQDLQDEEVQGQDAQDESAQDQEAPPEPAAPESAEPGPAPTDDAADRTPEADAPAPEADATAPEPEPAPASEPEPAPASEPEPASASEPAPATASEPALEPERADADPPAGETPPPS